MKPIWISTALFTLVALIAFSLWAFPLEFLQGSKKLYPAIAIVFILGGAPSMLPAFRANNGKTGQTKYLLLFWPAFMIFSAAWWFFWDLFLDHLGEVFGSFLGLLGLIIVFRCGFRMTRSVWQLLGIAFTWYTVNYYLSELTYTETKSISAIWATPVSRLCWGLFFGLGMGAALSYITDSLRPRNSGSE